MRWDGFTVAATVPTKRLALSGVTLLPFESVDMWDVLSVNSGHGFYRMKQRTSGELSNDRIKRTTSTEAQSEGCA